MTIRLTSDLEEMIRRCADERRVTPEAVVVDALRERFLPPLSSAREPLDEWKARLRSVATHCGVSLSDEAVSSEGLYD